MPRGPKMMSTSVSFSSLSHALSSQPSGGRSGRIPASSSAWSARSASSPRTRKSRSLRLCGAPRAQHATLPASAYSTPASRSAAAAFLRLASISSNVERASPMSVLYPAERSRDPSAGSPRVVTEIEANGRPAVPPVRIAAAGDMHCQPARAAEAREAFGRLEGEIDLLLLAGDLTTYGEPEQAQVLADACRGLGVPTFAVW